MVTILRLIPNSFWVSAISITAACSPEYFGTKSAQSPDAADSSNPPTKGDEPGNVDEPGNADEDRPKKEKVHMGDVETCAAATGVAQSQIRVHGNGSVAVVNVLETVSARVTGHQSTLVINAGTAESEDVIRGICIFAAGDESTVKVNINSDVGKLYYRARGNHANLEVTVNHGAKLIEFISDLGGNQPQVTLSGEGDYPGKASRN